MQWIHLESRLRGYNDPVNNGNADRRAWRPPLPRRLLILFVS